MAEHKKLTVADLLAMKEKPLAQTADVYVPALDRIVTIERRSLMDYQRAVDAINNATTTEEQLRATFEIIYTFCPILHDPELQAGYGTDQAPHVPPDIVPMAFQQNAGAIKTVFNAILELYGDGVRDEVKN